MILQEEIAWHGWGWPFTSGVRITSEGIEVTRLLLPTARGDSLKALTGKSVLLLSATPDPVLRAWVYKLGLDLGVDYRPTLELPPQVRIVQDVTAF